MRPRAPQRLLLALAISLSLVGAAGGENWPSFRGEHASGISRQGVPPLVWDGKTMQNVRWKTAMPGLAHSSPIVWGDRVFVTTAVSSQPAPEFRHGAFGDVDMAKDEGPQRWIVYALDKASGKILWQQVAAEGIPKTRRHLKSSHASSTPATDGRYVVASFGSEGLFCYNFAGALVWRKDLGTLDAGWFYDPDYQWGYGSSPVIYKNFVIVQCDIQKNSFIAAYDLATGKTVWRTPREEIPSWGTPTICESGGTVELVANGSKFIRGYHPDTGQERWRLGPNSEITAPTPVCGGGLIFVTSGYRPIQPIYAIRAGASGDISLAAGAETNRFIAWSKKKGGPYLPTPLLDGDFLYTCGNSSILTCYRAGTGEVVYQERVGAGGTFTASPIAGPGRVYLTSEEGDVYVVQPGPAFKLLATNPMGDVCLATPALTDGVLFVRTRNALFAVSDLSH